MWLSAEITRVPAGQAFVAAWGLRWGESGMPTISGISRTKPSAMAVSLCARIFF